MRTTLVVGFIFTTALCAAAQSSDLRTEQQKLTDDCKAIREYAGKLYAEAGKSELNRDVALAHVKEVVKYMTSIEQHMKATKGMLSGEQLKTVGQEFGFMQQGCSSIKEYVRLLQKEIEKKSPDHASVKKLATDLRMELAGLSNIHELAKKKLAL